MKRLLVVAAVATLALTAGCLGPGTIDEAALDEPADYDWNTSTAGSVTIEDDQYRAVLTLENRTNVSLFGPDEFGGRAALPVRAVQYRHPNGTHLNASDLTVAERDDRTVIEVPEPGGHVAYTASVNANSLYLPVAVNGSHAVTLPEGTDFQAPIVGRARPSGFEREVTDGQVTIVWENPTAELITVDYYSERNLYIFGGVLALGVLIAGLGVAYYRRQLRTLSAKRASMGPEDDGP